jgi:predicted DNA-binding ribbon-helix-helix protein
MTPPRKGHKIVAVRMPQATYAALKRIAKPTKMDVGMLLAHFAERGLAQALDAAKAEQAAPQPSAPPVPGLPT